MEKNSIYIYFKGSHPSMTKTKHGFNITTEENPSGIGVAERRGRKLWGTCFLLLQGYSFWVFRFLCSLSQSPTISLHSLWVPIWAGPWGCTLCSCGTDCVLFFVPPRPPSSAPCVVRTQWRLDRETLQSCFLGLVTWLWNLTCQPASGTRWELNIVSAPMWEEASGGLTSKPALSLFPIFSD